MSIAIFSIGVLPLPASADSPTPVVINAHPCQFAPVELGIWEASGAINDSGKYIKTGGASSPPKATFFTVETAREEFLFTGVHGTFNVHAEERSFGPGVWQIEPGTGAYVDTSGHGDTAFSFTPTPSCFSNNFSFTFALSGIASKVG